MAVDSLKRDQDRIRMGGNMGDSATDISSTPAASAVEFVSTSQRLLAEVVAGFYGTAGLDSRLLGTTPCGVHRVDVTGVASIGFVSDHVRGALLVSPTPELLRDSHPLRARELSPAQIKDWLGETSNQLLGRLRNKFIAYNVNLLSDTPLLLEGSVRIGGLRRTPTMLDFDVSGHALRLWWDVQIDPELRLELSDEQARAEGELQLF